MDEIMNDDEYESVLADLDRLMREGDRTDAQRDYIRRLAAMVEEYERTRGVWR